MENGKRISIKEARVLEQEYVKTRANSLNVILKKKGLIESEDVRDVWFDLEALKSYIPYVEEEAEKKGISKNLGLRVYLGAYPNDQKHLSAGKATVFFIPTQQLVSEKQDSFDLVNENLDEVDGFNFGTSGWPPNGI